MTARRVGPVLRDLCVAWSGATMVAPRLAPPHRGLLAMRLGGSFGNAYVDACFSHLFRAPDQHLPTTMFCVESRTDASAGL